MEYDFGKLVFGENAVSNLMKVLTTTHTAGAGEMVKDYEKKWAELFGYKNNVAVSSGTAADTAACIALHDFGAQRGDEIIAPACAFVAVGNSIRMAGFKPVFVDIERETLNINPRLIEERVTPRTRAIMAVHTMGKPCEMDTIASIAQKHGLFVIEDCCEAHGAKYNEQLIGSWGNMATFSSYVSHLISSMEGGMISTSDERIAGILRSIRNHGRPDGETYFNHIRFGGNFKMNELEAAVGLADIEDFWSTFNTRKDNLNYLLAKTEDLKEFAFFNSEDKTKETVCPHAFSVTLKDPKHDYPALYKHLQDNRINCKRNFGSMPTQHKAFEFLGHKIGEFPEAEYVGDNGLHFGVHKYLTRAHLDFALEVLHEYFAKFY